MLERNKADIIAENAKNLNELKESITPEDLARLQKIYQEVQNLYTSLTSSSKESIRHNYGIIVKAQTENKINQVDVRSQKIYIWNEIAKVYAILVMETIGYFSSSIEKYLNANGVNLTTTPDNLLNSAQEFLAQELTNNPLDNKFRVSPWLEIVQNIKNSLRPLLENNT